MNLSSTLRLIVVFGLLAIVQGAPSLHCCAFAQISQTPADTVISDDLEALERARDQAEASLSAHPDDLSAQTDEVQASERMALRARATGDFDQALAILLRAQKFAPENTRLLYDLGVLEEEMKLYRDADRTVSRAIELGGTDPYLLYAAARVKLDLGQLDAAEERIQAYLKLRPDDASAHYALGRIDQQGMRFEEAQLEFQRSIELQPKQTESYFQLGEIELKQGKYDAALASYSITLKSAPKHVGALVGVGMARFQQKQYALALDPLRKAVATEPNYQPGHYYLGLTLARLGEREQSAKELAEATRLADQDNHKAIQQLHILQPSETGRPN